MEDTHCLDAHIQKKVEAWLQAPFDLDTQKQVRALLSHNKKVLHDAFYTNLSFGTAGLRGLMGVGCNRINRYTIAMATQGLANYLVKNCSTPSVAIAYDCRKDSDVFAKEAACVLAGNGIRVYLSKELRPTPFLSFICRHRNCSAAIMITASHNPPEYNGYKVYWSDGSQVVYPHDEGIIQEVNKIVNPSQVEYANITHQLIEYLDDLDDQSYIKALAHLQNFPDKHAKEGSLLNIVFSNLHGTAITLLPTALESWGFTQVSYVEEQKHPDGSFPTIANPNPELKEALQMGVDLLLQKQGDILLATDPDDDRDGVAVRQNNHIFFLTGNQIASICLYHLLETFKMQNRLGTEMAVVSTIVTTRLLYDLCKAYKIHYFETLTGFKYIGEKIREFEEDPHGYEFLFGAEESYGFLYGTHARDKDAIITSCLLSEIALLQKEQGKTLIDLLYSIYKQFGVYQEAQLSINLPDGEQSQILMQRSLDHLRSSSPNVLDGQKITSFRDYLIPSKDLLKILPKSNVLSYTCEDGSYFIIRPSGTEPKVKIYGMMKALCQTSVEETLRACSTTLKKRLEVIKTEYLHL